MSENTQTLRVPGMSCGHCVSAIDEELRELPGVTGVTVDLEGKLVTVRGRGLDIAALQGGIERAGYEVER